MDEEKVAELMNIDFTQQGKPPSPWGFDRPHGLQLCPGGTRWLTEYSNAQSLIGESSRPGARCFKVVLIILPAS